MAFERKSATWPTENINLNEKRKNVKTKEVCKDCGGNTRYDKDSDTKQCVKCKSTNTKMINTK